MTSPLDHHPRGKALFERLFEIQGHRKMILGFSRGKDAIAAAIECMKHCEAVIPVYYETGCPGLEFVRRSLRYYEKHLFKRRIHVVPHPNMLRILKNAVFQDWDGFYIIDMLGIDKPNGDRVWPKWTHEDVRRWVCKVEKLPMTTFSATGVRAADSVTRRTAIARNGPITTSKHTAHVIWDWNKERMLKEIGDARIKLPFDYAIWGRTFDGIDARFMIPLRDRFPQDYERLKAWFPLLEADCIRYERIRREQAAHAEKTN